MNGTVARELIAARILGKLALLAMLIYSWQTGARGRTPEASDGGSLLVDTGLHVQLVIVVPVPEPHVRGSRGKAGDARAD